MAVYSMRDAARLLLLVVFLGVALLAGILLFYWITGGLWMGGLKWL